MFTLIKTYLEDVRSALELVEFFSFASDLVDSDFEDGASLIRDEITSLFMLV
jgi:hypothetical protein